MGAAGLTAGQHRSFPLKRQEEAICYAHVEAKSLARAMPSPTSLVHESASPGSPSSLHSVDVDSALVRAVPLNICLSHFGRRGSSRPMEPDLS